MVCKDTIWAVLLCNQEMPFRGNGDPCQMSFPPPKNQSSRVLFLLLWVAFTCVLDVAPRVPFRRPWKAMHKLPNEFDDICRLAPCQCELSRQT